MLRDLTVILSLALTGVVIASACSSPEECGDCCDACSGGTAQCGHDCGTTSIMPNDAGPTCTEEAKPRVVCTPGSSQPCQSPSTSQAPASCAAGQQTCNAAGTGFSVCDDVRPHPDECDEASFWRCAGDAPACGSATWATAIAGAGDEAARSIAVDATGNSVTALSAGAGDVTVGATTLTFAAPGQVVAKFDPNGAPLWAVALVNATSAAVATDDTGATYVTGISTGALEIIGHAVPTGSSKGAYLAKISPGGALVWARSLERPRRKDFPATSFAPAAVAIAQGAPVIAGTYFGAVALFGDFVLVDTLALTGVVARYDPMTGRPAWATPLKPAEEEALSAVAGDDAGEVVVGGQFNDPGCSTPHLLYARLGVDGSLEWVQRLAIPARITSIRFFGDFIAATGVAARPVEREHTFVDAPGFVLATQGADLSWYVPTIFQGEAVAVNAADDVIAAGTTPGGGAGVIKLDVVGDRFYEHAYAATPNEGDTSASIAIHALAVAPDDGVVVGGAILGRSDLALGFGGVPVASTAGRDAFLARLDP